MVGVGATRLRDAVDGYGNAVTMLYAEGPIEASEITGHRRSADHRQCRDPPRHARATLPPALFLRDAAHDAEPR